MANGFIIVERNEQTNAPVAFWNGATLGEDMQEASLVETKQDARMLSGQLQAQYPEKEITILPARTAIQLATSPAQPVAVAPPINAR